MRLQAGELSGNTASLLAIGGACLIGALALLLLPRKSGNLLGALACLTNGADLVMYNIVPGLKMGYVGAFASLIVGLSIWGACWLILDLMRADPASQSK